MDPAPPPLGLFMVELLVADWPRAVAWYRDALGLPVLLHDAAGSFALLKSGGCRLALKAGEPPARRDGFRLVFHVPDLDAARTGLIARSVDVSEPVENRAEGYRAARLTDPEGTPIQLFAWTRDGAGSTRGRVGPG